MSSFLVRRLLLSLVVLWGVFTLSYFLTVLAPGDVAEALAGQRTDPEVLEAMRAKLGVDRDPLTRYFAYLNRILHGEWGRSSRYDEPVWTLILERFPRTALLAVSALLFAVLVGVTLGVLSGVFQGTWIDRAISVGSLAGISAPVFWVGLLAMWLISLKLGLLPPAGYERGNLRYLILPALTLGLRSIALITRISRASLIEVGRMAFITTARAKGVSPIVLYGKHALRNVSLPLITVVGLDLGSYLSGSVLTEKVFGWPGLGGLTVDAILARDTALINATVVFMAALFVLVNLAVDLLYGILDPRVRSGG